MTGVAPERPKLFTVGHSNHSGEAFLALLMKHSITAIADVRSLPVSRFSPQFNKEPLASLLRGAGISYVFLGRELGARRSESEAYEDGQAKYHLVSRLSSFESGLARLRKGAAMQRIALMCAEADPLVCHRSILICRNLRSSVEPVHILANGALEPLAEAEERLLAMLRRPATHMFRDREDLVEEAYDLQAARIAYVKRPDESELVNAADGG